MKNGRGVVGEPGLPGWLGDDCGSPAGDNEPVAELPALGRTGAVAAKVVGGAVRNHLPQKIRRRSGKPSTSQS